jgi:hypothetical protein
VEISPTFQSHPPEEALEQYVFGRLNEQKAVPLEEHLLVCETCQASLEELDQYIGIMKAGAARFVVAPRPSMLAQIWDFVRPRASERPRRLAWAAAFAGGCAAVIFSLSPARYAPPTSVLLDSFRGGESITLAHAPARKPLDLSINLDLSVHAAPAASQPDYRVEVVTASGKLAWSGTQKPGAQKGVGGMLLMHLPRGLDAGSYWVRLYAPPSQLLGEFGLRLD